MEACSGRFRLLDRRDRSVAAAGLLFVVLPRHLRVDDAWSDLIDATESEQYLRRLEL